MHIRALFIGIVLCTLLPAVSLAQELRLVEDSPTIIDDGEAYTAYYGKLSGEPHVLEIHAMDPFRLSVIILTPNVEGKRTDFSATVFDGNKPDEPIIVLDGTASEWQWFFDTAGRDEYLAGPVLRGGLPAGVYNIHVSNPDNDGAYVIVLGEESSWFSPAGLVSRYTTLPTIKSDFFGKSGAEAFVTPLLMWPVISILAVITVLVFALYIIRRRRGLAEITV